MFCHGEHLYFLCSLPPAAPRDHRRLLVLWLRRLGDSLNTEPRTSALLEHAHLPGALFTGRHGSGDGHFAVGTADSPVEGQPAPTPPFHGITGGIGGSQARRTGWPSNMASAMRSASYGDISYRSAGGSSTPSGWQKSSTHFHVSGKL